MIINVESENFIPKDFIICNFYGRDVCFIWNEDEFVCFEYTYKNSTNKLNVLKAPAKIKDIREFDERVFFLCSPSGIYKLTEGYGFASLSESGIELGGHFCEVLTSNNGMLILKNKKSKSTTKLFSASSVHVLSLNDNKTNKSLRRALLVDNYNSNVNLCIIANNNKLFKVYDQVVQIIYSCDYEIIKIEPIEKNDLIVGAVLQTSENVIILIHLVNDKLKYNKIFLKTKVSRMCAVMDKSEDNSILFIYTDGLNTYYTKKILSKDLVQEIGTEEIFYKSFKPYQSKYMVFLNDSKELLQIEIEKLQDKSNQSVNDYVKLEPAMLKGLERILENICQNTVELDELKTKVAEKGDKLKRINLFVNKQHLKYCPEDNVKKLLNQTFLITKFEKVLPKNTTVVKMLKSRGKSIFAMKHVKDYETIVEMPISIPNLSSKLYTTIDLITYRNNGAVWCLIKNYIQDPFPSKNNKVHLTNDQLEFVKKKLVQLKSLIEENNTSMEALADIKRSVREQIQKL